jgi:hypothetical protein
MLYHQLRPVASSSSCFLALSETVEQNNTSSQLGDYRMFFSLLY